MPSHVISLTVHCLYPLPSTSLRTLRRLTFSPSPSPPPRSPPPRCGPSSTPSAPTPPSPSARSSRSTSTFENSSVFTTTATLKFGIHIINRLNSMSLVNVLVSYKW
uniref:Uncharacterized protein n=1 Tax=Zea mays TaxID=4577 RepID=A0A804NFR3_MAIZE